MPEELTSDEAVDAIRHCLSERSVAAEDKESPEEKVWLDRIGDPENRMTDLLIYRSMSLARSVGAGGLTEFEINPIARLLEQRIALAGLVRDGSVRERLDGRTYRYLVITNETAAGPEEV